MPVARIFKESAVFAGGAVLVQHPVAIDEDGVYGDHGEIQNVQNQDDVHAVEQFVGDTTDVAYKNSPLENNAFARSGTAAQGFDDVHGPGCTEAEQHTGFKNTHDQ